MKETTRPAMIRTRIKLNYLLIWEKVGSDMWSWVGGECWRQARPLRVVSPTSDNNADDADDDVDDDTR